MKTVLVTRPLSQAKEFCELLGKQGIESVCLPMIEIAPIDNWAPVDAAFRRIGSYDALVFTSANAVEYFIERMARAGANCDMLPAGFGVGKKTKEAMSTYGIDVAPTADTLNAKMLASEICTFLTQAGYEGVTGMKFLFPCGEKAREELPAALAEHGAVVDSLPVYKTILPSGIDDARIREIEAMFAQNTIVCVAFFSPSAVENFLILFPDFPTKYTANVAAIGATTADALRSRSLIPAVVSSSPEAETFANAIWKFVLKVTG